MIARFRLEESGAAAFESSRAFERRSQDRPWSQAPTPARAARKGAGGDTEWHEF
jgi:hypothetical protein